VAEPEQDILARLSHFKTAGGAREKGLVVEHVAVRSDTGKFLARMEDKRRAQPEVRAIDLRRMVKTPCFEYTYEKQTHFLDERGRREFEKGIAEFNGQYTVGVFEDVTQAQHTVKARMREIESRRRLRARGERLDQRGVAAIGSYGGSEEELADFSSQMDVIPFGFFTQRSEQRMTYVVDLEIELPDGAKAQGRSMDISPRGLKVRTVSVYPFAVEDKIGIKLTGFVNRFDGPFEQAIDYQVLDVQLHDELTILRLAMKDDPDESGLSKFLDEFIRKNSHRYKYDVEDLQLNVTAKGYERYYLQSLCHLPFLVCKQGDTLRVDSVMSSFVNDRIRAHWQNALGGLELESVLTPEFLQALAGRAPDGLPGFVFFMTLKLEDETWHFRVMDFEFKDDDQRSAFFTLGGSLGEIHAYRIVLTGLNIPDDEVIQAARNVVGKISAEHARTMQDRIDALVFEGMLTDVSEEIVPTVSLDDESIGVPERLARIANFRFQTPEEGSGTQCEQVELSYLLRRRNPRYRLRSGVLVKNAHGSRQGNVIDFSEDGALIALDDVSGLVEGSEITITWQEMAERIKKSDIVDVPYRVVGGDMRQKHLRVCMLENDRKCDKAKRFLNGVVERNRSKLKMLHDEEVYVQFVRVVERILVSSLVTVPFFISQDERHHVYVRKIGVSEVSSPLLWFFHNEEGKYDLSTVANTENLRHLVREGSLFDSHKAKARETTVYMYKDMDPQSGQEVIESRNESEFKTVAERSEFIRRARQAYDFRFVKMFVSPTGQLLEGELDARLEAIRRSSAYKHKVLREELASVIGLGELLDTTDEVCMREKLQATTVTTAA